MDDAAVVTAQIGREPRGPWRVASRCGSGAPRAIVTAPATQEGVPFPTLFYLTCPHLVRQVSHLEASGGVAEWRTRLEHDEEQARRMRAADIAYRLARAGEAGGCDPLPGVGIAGQRDPLATKCLHAHVAACLGGIGDPIGEAVLDALDSECDDTCPGRGVDGR